LESDALSSLFGICEAFDVMNEEKRRRKDPPAARREEKRPHTNEGQRESRAMRETPNGQEERAIGIREKPCLHVPSLRPTAG